MDPELLLPYLIDRRGASHEAMLATIEEMLAAGQASGRVRPGRTAPMARAVLLTAQSFLLSAPTMTDPAVSLGDLDAELTALLEGYVRP
ncbi:hypothetical protein [Thermocatellispora tengchongensis]|uniref:hypothetical protein n=1 Tax=Thermocatellispora tengchongensis TaxID=1073253 RepID=UPI003631B89B